MQICISTHKLCLIAAILFLLHNRIFAQDQRTADSLAIIYQEAVRNGTVSLELLRSLSFNEVNDLNKALEYAGELIIKAEEAGDYVYLHRGYLQRGNTYRLLGDLDQALDMFFRSGEAAIKATYPAGDGIAKMSIADVYSVMGNSNNARIYYEQSIDILRNSSDSLSLATALSNAGDEYFRIGEYDLALAHFSESGQIFEEIDYLIGRAYNLGNTGMVYAAQGLDDSAERFITQAIAMLEDLSDYYSISVFLTYMADIYVSQGDFATAFMYANQSLDLATGSGLREQISDANLKLSELFEQSGNNAEAYKFYKDHIRHRDSLRNIESVQQMADLRTDYEVAQKQVEVDLLNQQKRTQRIIVYATAMALFLIGLLALGLYRRYKFIQKTNRIIAMEKNRSDQLLLNILPGETAAELKENGKVEAKRFESVSILFTDFVKFSHHAENLSAEDLVSSVDFYFSGFDKIIEKYGLEKIKTVGDAYMCAAGLPFVTQDHALKMVYAALEIINFVEQAQQAENLKKAQFKIRIGINTGPVVAGVVGTKKFAYDIWGDAVNVASRMESNSEPGKINISEHTFNLVKDFFNCTYRGEIDVKNRGRLKMYFVKSVKDPVEFA